MRNGNKLCPFCGEEIKEIAKKCRFCGKFLNNDKYESREINYETKYTKSIRKSITIKDEVFEYKRNEIFYKDNIPSKFGYYWWRILLLFMFIACGIIPGLIILGPLFFAIEPWNKFLLINDNVIGFWNRGSWVWEGSKKKLINKQDVTKIEYVGKKKSIYVNRKKKNGKEKYFYFGKIHNFDKLLNILEQQGYNLISVEK